MRKMDKIKKGVCIGAAVLLLGACGQADSAPSETAAESSVEESVQEEKETDGDKEETEEEKTEESSEKDAEEENASGEESSADAGKESLAPEEGTSPETEKETTAAEETPAQDSAQGNEKKVKDIYEEISQTVALNSPMLVPDDFIMNYYGIDVSTLDEYVFSMSEAAISAETIVILKAKDAGSTGALSASLQTVIDQKRSEMENYLPDQFQIVDKSSVQVKGNYVYLVISEQADAITRMIQADIP